MLKKCWVERRWWLSWWRLSFKQSYLNIFQHASQHIFDNWYIFDNMDDRVTKTRFWLDLWTCMTFVTIKNSNLRNHRNPTIRSDTGQHLQFLQSLFVMRWDHNDGRDPGESMFHLQTYFSGELSWDLIES